ncbi:MAG: DUF448 domain-containing protein [Sphingomonadaceae bacterium]|nr:DUF448 domain-containing protein [Sphingomonadaceae bacterium]
MTTNENLAAVKPKQRDKRNPERKCILSGEVRARDELIRLALGPSGEILPDVRAKAPGRGAWIGVDRATLETAQAKGQLRGALARSFKSGDLAIPDDLADRITGALEKNALDRIGLESRSGAVITGSDRIRETARAGRVHLLLHAADAAEDGRRKLDQAWRVGKEAEGSGRQGLVIPADRSILGAALGRENVVHIAIVDERAAKRVSGAISRWMNFTGPGGMANPCGSGSQGMPGNERGNKGTE